MLIVAVAAACSGLEGPQGTAGPAGSPGPQGEQVLRGPLAPGVVREIDMTLGISISRSSHFVVGEKPEVTAILKGSLGLPFAKDDFSTIGI
ncbi:MAG: hypothetical protein V3S51_05830 [Dehalococcoidia bacterium]